MWNFIVKSVNRIIENITMLLLTIMVIIIFLQIVSRALLGSSFPWTEELARFLMIWVIFLGAGFAFQYGAHISIESIIEKLPRVLQKVIPLLIMISSLIFFLVLLDKGIELCSRTIHQNSTILKIPMGYVYLVFPISAVLQMVNIIDITIRYYRTGKVVREEY